MRNRFIAIIHKYYTSLSIFSFAYHIFYHTTENITTRTAVKMQNPLSMRFWRKAPLYLVDICRNSVYGIMINVNSFKYPFIYIMSKKVKTSIKNLLQNIINSIYSPFLLSFIPFCVHYPKSQKNA